MINRPSAGDDALSLQVYWSGRALMRAMLLIAAMLGPKNFCRFCLFLVVAGGFLFYCVTR